MKPVFKCDYCKFMGTEEEVKEHEIGCMRNYDRSSCYTCKHKKMISKNGKWTYKCEADIDIPEGKIYEFCKSYERNQDSNFFTDLFGKLI